MSELYWLTRLDAICGLLFFVAFISGIAWVYLLVGYFVEGGFESESHLKWTKRSLYIVIVSSIFLVFIPSTKEAFAIIGVGGTIEYLKGNEKAKQLPDKCIDALDKFINEYTEEKK